MRNLILLTAVFALSSCGIDVKTPKEMDIKLKLDAKDIVQSVRNYSSTKVPPQYLKFLKEPQLKAQILDNARKLKGECMMPGRAAVKGQQEGENYVFSVHQICYVVDNSKSKTYKSEFDIVGYVNTNTLKYELLQDDEPEIVVTEVDPQEYLAAKAAGHFVTP